MKGDTMSATLATTTMDLPTPAEVTGPVSVPMTVELEDAGEAVADDILAASVRGDRNTMRAAKGGTHAKFEPRAWSYGGQVD